MKLLKKADLTNENRISSRQNSKSYKLTVRIPIMILFVVTAVVLLMCGCFFALSRNTVSELLDNQVNSIANENNQTVYSYLVSMDVYAESLRDNVLRCQKLERETAEPMLKAALEDVVASGRVFSAYFAFEPNQFFTNTPNGLSYYAYTDGNKIALDINNDYDVYGGDDYYAPAKSMLHTHVTEPYSYELSNGETVWLITLSTPIIDSNGKFLGVANCDILADSIGGLNYTTGHYSLAYSAIITSGGYYVAHTYDQSLVGSTSVPEEFPSVLAALANQQTFAHHGHDAQLGGSDAIVCYEAVSLPGSDLSWVSVFAVDSSEAYAQINSVTLAVVFIGVLGILLLAIVCTAILRRALSPVVPLMQIAEKTNQFDLSEDEQEYCFPPNELGMLADTFLSMSRHLRAVIRDENEVLEAMASGDFTVKSQCEEEYVGGLKKILDSIQNISASLGNTLCQIDNASDRVSNQAEQVSNGAQNLAQGATEQAASVEELASTIQDISDNVKATAANTVSATAQVQESYALMEQCDSQVRGMKTSMDEINRNSQDISKIIKTIEDIAFQTNILALNAAVEAARAGEAGKGFAVVADEVRNLANKSAEASKETAALIAAAVSSVEQGSLAMDATAESMGQLREKFAAVANIVSDISSAAEQQSVALDQVSLGVEQISSVVQTNSATAEESAASSNDLNSQAVCLKTLVARFRLNRN